MTLTDRGTAFEDKFAHDADLRFRVAARRNKLLGLWAAARLGHADAVGDAYATTVVIADMAEAGDDDVVAKLVADLAGVGVDEAQIRAALADCAVTARQQIMEAS